MNVLEARMKSIITLLLLATLTGCHTAKDALAYQGEGTASRVQGLEEDFAQPLIPIDRGNMTFYE